MRGYAASVSLLIVAVAIGCGSDGGHSPFVGAGGEGEEAGSGGTAAGGSSGAAGHAGKGVAGRAEPADAGAAGMDAEGGSAGEEEAMAGRDSGGTGGAGGTAGTGGAAPPPSAPNAPTDLVLHVLSDSAVQLAWTDHASNETSYDVYWSTSADKPSVPNATLAADVVTATAEGLDVGREYTFWVEASNGVGPSAAITGKATPIPVPAAPTGLVVTAGATDAVLTWTDAATTETGYRIYLATTDTQPTTAQYELPANTTQFTVSGDDLTPYKPYHYWVVAYNAIGNSAPASGTATTGVLPGAPSSVSVDPEQSVWSVQVSWVDNSTNTAKYNVYWSTDDTQPALPGATVDGSAISYKMTQKYGNQTYRFWVESENAIGRSSATKGTASKATYDLVWTDLYYDLTANTVRQAVQDTFGLLSDPAPSGANTALWGYHTSDQAVKGPASSLTPGITWSTASQGIDTTVTQYFWAEARTPLGSQFSVRSLVPPAAPTGLNATAGAATAALYWTASANTQTYQVFRAPGTPQTPAVLADAKLYTSRTSAPTSGSPLTVSDLNPGTPYTFWVRSVGPGLNGTGFPSPFISQTVTTPGTYLGPNLALGKTAVASSQTGDVASRVIDGDIGTRWQANSTNANEWIYVNLGDGVTAKFTHVKLVWENAYAKTYDIEVCAATCDDMDPTHPDTWAWQLAYTTPSAQTLSGFPNYQMVPLTTQITGQFIRLKAKTLALAYGVSLWEFEPFSAP